MGSYLESIFERLETLYVNPTKSQIMDFVSGKGTKHQKRRSGYANFATQLREPFTIRQNFEDTEDFDELRNLRKEAERLDSELGRSELIRDIDTKMKVVAEEIKEITREREIERLGEEKAEAKEIERQEKELAKQIALEELEREREEQTRITLEAQEKRRLERLELEREDISPDF